VSNPNDEILAYLTTAPTSAFSGQKVVIVGHWPGSANLLWRTDAGGQDAVLKMYLDAGQVHSRREFDGQTLFAPHGLAPQPLWLDRTPETLPRAVMVYRWVDGDSFDVADDSQWQLLAQALAQVHAAPVDELQRFSPHPLNLSYFWSVLGPSLPPLQNWLAAHRLVRLADLVGLLHAQSQQIVEAALPLWGQMMPAAVHGDLKLENILHSFGSLVLLDWEMSGRGDGALEAARFLHEQRSAVPAAILDRWLDAYLERLGDPAAPARIDLYRRQLLPLQDAAYLLGGAMKLAPEDRLEPELLDNAPLLAATLRLVLAQTAQALNTGNVEGDEGIAAECSMLFSEEILI
jgi:hypothetical protein